MQYLQLILTETRYVEQKMSMTRLRKPINKWTCTAHTKYRIQYNSYEINANCSIL